MKGVTVKGILLSLIAIVLVSGVMGAAYAWPNSDDNPRHKVDLKLRDQDEPKWQDGVSATWVATNMAPGDEFAFEESFVELRGKFPKKVDMGTVNITCSYNPWTDLQPDEMAKQMVITRYVYEFTYKKKVLQIDCLTGELTVISGKNKHLHEGYTNEEWQIRDVDDDDRVTFCDLNQSPLANLPLPRKGKGARFEMSVRFHQDAGNEFQGDTFNLTMIYALEPR